MPFIGVQPASALLTSADIQDGQITTAKVADDAITGAKIENNPTIAGTLNASAGLTTPSGHIIQVVTAIDDGAQNTVSTSLIDTGLTVDITPKFQNSKMQIFANMYSVYSYDANNSVRCSLRRVVGGTNTEIGDHDATTIGYTQSQDYSNIAMQQLDTPNTTSTITYKVQYSSSGGYVVYINADNTQSQICVMEIAQ